MNEQAMTQKQDNIDLKIEIDRINLLYRRAKAAVLTLFITCSVYILILARHFPWHRLLAWYILFCAVLGMRWVASWFFLSSRKRAKDFSLSFRLNVFRLGILATGIMLGSLNVFFFSWNSLPFLLLAIFLPLGITAGAVVMLLDFASFCIYSLALLLPIIYQTISTDDRSYSDTAIFLIILMIFFLKTSKKYIADFTISRRLRYENTALLEKLEQEKQKLNNRLVRILNDSSNEIFVVDADSLACLQVNRGAIENLGYSQEEFSSINLLDIFTGFDHASFFRQVGPLYEGSQEFILLQGKNRRKDGSTYPVEARLQLSTEDSPPIIVVTVQNITERHEWEKKLLYQANFDQLTGLRNRHAMQSCISQAFARAQRNSTKVVLLFIDLDNFKNINDSLGHNIGDIILQQTADRIRELLRESDIPARTGGDEFTILLEDIRENVQAEVVARKLIQQFRQPFQVGGREIYSTISIGVSIFPDDGVSPNELLKFADMAMYRAKEKGRNNFCFFSREMCRDSDKEMRIITHLRNALENGELTLFFQPKVDITDGRLVGAEVLLRWHSPELGNIPPNIFIHLAEQMGFMEDIGSWVLEQACREAMDWRKRFGINLQISVNISPQQFRTGSLIDVVDHALAATGLPREQLELEITESLLLQDSDKPFTILTSLSERGIRLALDDFGTGYSSLSYLKRFPLQVLKIDRSFINDLHRDKSSRALVEAIIAMAQSMKLEIVAEGIENENQIAFLRRHGVNIVQGFYFSPPVAAEQFHAYLQDNLPEQWKRFSSLQPKPIYLFAKLGHAGNQPDLKDTKT